MKPLKILRRPADAAPGVRLAESSVASRVSAQISASVEGALARERERLERSFAARQQALLDAVTTMLTSVLERVVSSTAEREAIALTEAVANLIPAPPEPKPAPEPEVRARLRRRLWPLRFPKCKSRCGNSSSILPVPSTSVSRRISGAPMQTAAVEVARCAQAVAAAQFKVKDAVDAVALSAVNERKAQKTPEESALAAVQKALDEGRVRDALKLCVGQSALVRAKAINGALESDMDPAELFRDSKMNRHDVVGLIALLAVDLNDRTESRLSWLFELVSTMDEIEADEKDEFTEATKKHLKDVIDNLKKFAANAGLPPAKAKHIKLLVHVLNAHLSTM